MKNIFLKGINLKYLFCDFPNFSEIDERVRKNNLSKTFTGGVRINKGMYRTEKETMRYFKKSLARKLP